MNTATIKKMFVENRDDLGRLISLRIAPPNAEDIVKINDTEMAKAALRAGVEYLRHGDYDHPWTEVGLHIKTEFKNLNSIKYAENVGVVDLRSYGGDRFDHMGEEGRALKINQLHPDMNWYQLDWRNGKFALKHINPRRVVTAQNRHDMSLSVQKSLKHDAMDMLIDGNIIDARTLAFAVNKEDASKPSYTDKVLATIFEVNDEKSKQMKLEAYGESQESWANYRPVAEAKQNGTLDSAAERAHRSEIKVAGQPEAISVTELPFGNYNIVYGSKVKDRIKWQGKPEQAIQLAEAIRRNRELVPA